jgi:hypothetical protein
MSTVRDDNFACEGARDYLSLLAAKLVATITEIHRDGERLALDEDGESMFMPSVELLALLCERYDVEPPKAATIKQWEDKYLRLYDRTVKKCYADPDFQASRRKVIERTFHWLSSLSQSYWEN